MQSAQSTSNFSAISSAVLRLIRVSLELPVISAFCLLHAAHTSDPSGVGVGVEAVVNVDTYACTYVGGN